MSNPNTKIRRSRAFRFHPRHRRQTRRRKEISADSHPLSAGTERLSPHRPRQEHLPELRHRARVRRHLQSAHGRHQPDQGRRRIRGLHHRRRELAHRRLGRRKSRPETQRQNAGNRHEQRQTGFLSSPQQLHGEHPNIRNIRDAADLHSGTVLRFRLFRPDLRIRRRARQKRQGLRLRPDAGRNRRIPPQRQGKPVPQSQHRGKSRPVHAHEERRVPRRQTLAPRED